MTCFFRDELRQIVVLAGNQPRTRLEQVKQGREKRGANNRLRKARKDLFCFKSPPTSSGENFFLESVDTNRIAELLLSLKIRSLRWFLANAFRYEARQ
ncbi:MAG: hypothetical protein DME60_03010 [Verrucomicrobia bacterium]|nr:MAG: hypothetical protein DME60_03010 [Verrucomicrobiota bacterium]